MIGEEYLLYHNNLDAIIGREIEEFNSDFFVAQSSNEGQVACNPGTISPFSRTLEMTVYNSATTTSVPSCDRTCFVGANAGLTGYNQWATVFEDFFLVDSIASGIWQVNAGTGVLAYVPASQGVLYKGAVFGSSKSMQTPVSPTPLFLKLDRPCRITYEISNIGFGGAPRIRFDAGLKLTGGTAGTPRTAPGTYTEVYPTVGDGIIFVACQNDGAGPAQALITMVVIEQMENITTSQGTCITVGLNGDQIGTTGSPNPEIGGAIQADGLGALSADTLGNPFIIKGLRIVSRFQELFQQIWTIKYTATTGKVNTINWQPQNYISPTNANGFIVDAPDFEFPIDGNLSICTRTPWVETTEVAYWTIIFTIQQEVNDSGTVFFDQPIQKTDVPRPSGNPIVALLNKKQ